MILGTDASGVLDEDIPVRKGLTAGAELVLYAFVGTDGAGVMPSERCTILSDKYRGHHGRKQPKWPTGPTLSGQDRLALILG
jgi:hypothetical protein